MSIVKVKICGITNLKDARAATELGADMLGFNFYEQSPRYITPKKAMAIIDKLPAFVDTVALFVNAPIEEISKVVADGHFNWIQLHGDETPRFCNELASLNIPIIKALRVRQKATIERIDRYFTEAILLDAYKPKQYGGTGHSFNWSILKYLPRKIFLAGGINPENVCQAVETGVYGIDLCSGVEASPGKKDRRKMKKLFENIENANI